MFFLSGALYPTTKLPGWLQPLVKVNPLTYGVDLMRHELLADRPLAASRIQFAASFDVLFLVVFAVLALTLATLLFGTDEHLAPTLLSAAPRRARRAGRRIALPGRGRAGAPAGDTAIAATTVVAVAGDSGGRGLRSPGLLALGSIVEREFKRALRQRGRLASTFARPLLWLIAVGAGFSALIPGGHYQRYLLPGIVGMVILFSSMLSALGSIHDRQFGPMRMLLIAPVARGTIVLGKTASAALLAVAFAIVFSPLAWIFGIDVGALSYLAFVGAVVLTALALASLGMLAASRIRRLEDFAVAMNFVIFPMFFLSGALYPANKLPIWLQPIVRANPLTYGVDLMRHTLLASQTAILSPAQFAPGWDAAFLAGFTIVALTLAARAFGSDEHLAPMFLSATPRSTRRALRREAAAPPAPPAPLAQPQPGGPRRHAPPLGREQAAVGTALAPDAVDP
jgi:ABC-2 type transport system permease protein